MSNEVLTKIGNKAEWAAGGGGVQVVTFTGESPNALTSSHTGAEILEMAEKGLVIAKIVSDPLNSVLPLVTVNNYTGAMFLVASGALLTGLGVDLDGTAVKTYNYVS